MSNRLIYEVIIGLYKIKDRENHYHFPAAGRVMNPSARTYILVVQGALLVTSSRLCSGLPISRPFDEVRGLGVLHLNGSEGDIGWNRDTVSSRVGNGAAVL